MKIRYILLYAAIVLVLGTCIYFLTKPSLPPQPGAENSREHNTAFIYTCDSGQKITAMFLKGETIPPQTPGAPPTPGGSVSLILDDGREMQLHQTLSADGGRYANVDESFVFWSKGNSAIVQENGKESEYKNCVVK